jgi:hypothetical protein
MGFKKDIPLFLTRASYPNDSENKLRFSYDGELLECLQKSLAFVREVFLKSKSFSSHSLTLASSEFLGFSELLFPWTDPKLP